jgi:hypothetical protein
MARSLVKQLCVGIPTDLVEFFDDPPLVGDELLEDYRTFFGAIVVGLKPVDVIDWLYIKDVVDLSWQIRRERRVLADVIKSFQTEVVRQRLKETVDVSDTLQAATYRIFHASDYAREWANDPAARSKIDARLASKGYSPASGLAEAYMRGASQIDAIDKRIASYEARRMGIVREIERRNEKLASNLTAASSEVIDAEFSEAAE